MVRDLGRGIVHRAQSQSGHALEDLHKVIALEPDNAEAYYNRGLLYQSQHQHQFAIDDFSTERERGLPVLVTATRSIFHFVTTGLDV